jgi:hypothetical protein
MFSNPLRDGEAGEGSSGVNSKFLDGRQVVYHMKGLDEEVSSYIF